MIAQSKVTPTQLILRLYKFVHIKKTFTLFRYTIPTEGKIREDVLRLGIVIQGQT